MKNSMRHMLAVSALFSASLGAMAVSANTYVSWTEADHGVYADASGQEMTASVIDAYGEGWQKYSSFLGAERWVWTSSSNEAVYVHNDERRIAEKLVSFTDAIGKRYSITLDSCTTSAVLAEKRDQPDNSCGPV